MSTSSSSRAELLRRRLSGTGGTAPRAGITPVARDGALPLSFAQRRLWVLDRMQPGGTEYLMPLRLRLRGPVDQDALRRALDELVARHEVLRTRYLAEAGEPVQLVDPPGPMPLVCHDFRTDADSEHRVEEVVAMAGDTSMDLAAAWPVRANLMRVSDEDLVLLLTIHHIAADGWSESVLRSELDTLYTAFAAGRPSPLPPLPVQYADFAQWQRDRLSGAELDRQLDHWRSTLDGMAPLALPTDRPRGPVRDPAGAYETFTVPAGLAARLTALGRAHGATPFMVFLAAFQALLGRYARQDDVVVGSPVAGRDREETQNLVGLFVNTVVLRTDLSGDPTFLELLPRVRETALGAFSHQHTPFERLVDVLAPERDPSRNPLFQVCFQLAAAEPATEQAADPGVLRVEQEPVPWSAAKFDLSLALLTRADGSLAGHLEYATALFDAPTIRRMVGHLLRLLEVVDTAPDAPLSTVDILAPAERTRLLHERAGLGESVPADGTLTEVFAEQVRRAPDAVAVTCAGESLTYAELNARANRLAHRLLAMGAGPERLVGVSLDRSVDLVVALLGVLKAGAGYLPLDPGQPAARRAFMMADAECELVVGRAGADLPGRLVPVEE
ncbi:MAG TPA: condensation domain-containing protein, partial [Actinophytocola sp.]|nr:condensation domain-containing protein [Actinophytocola sp.]